MMRKIGLFIIGAMAMLFLLTHLVPLFLLVISLTVFYFVLKAFLKEGSFVGKVMWGIFGLLILGITLSNIPAFLGIAAACVLYFVYKKWNKKKDVMSVHDPFAHFENEWAELKRTY